MLNEIIRNPKTLNLLTRTELSNTDILSKTGNLGFIKKQDFITNVFNTAKEIDSKYVEVEHVFLTILRLTPKIDTLLLTYNSNLEILNNAARWTTRNREENDEVFFWQEDYELPPAGGIGRGLIGKITPLLDTMSEDFTDQVKHGYIKKVIGRKKEIQDITEMLSSDKANIILVGDPGSGKTSIIKGIAYEIITGTKHKNINNKRIISINIGKLMTGTRTPGEVATKITIAMEEIKGSGDIILFVDEIHELIKDDNETLAGVFSVLEPYISSPGIQFIAATSLQDYRKYIEPIGSFARLFNIIRIEEATEEDTLEILKDRAKFFEKKYKVIITYPAMRSTIKLSEKLVHERVLPDKAIAILGQACSKNQGKTIDIKTIAKEIAEMTNIPIESVNPDEAKKLLDMFSLMQKSVIGQDEALMQVTEALKRARVGIRNENKPIASFLFIGTTGVGKTETAKALAAEYFGDERL